MYQFISGCQLLNTIHHINIPRRVLLNMPVLSRFPDVLIKPNLKHLPCPLARNKCNHVVTLSEYFNLSSLIFQNLIMLFRGVIQISCIYKID